MTVTFFGHSTAPYSVRGLLKAVIIGLIEQQGANSFYVGNHGNFDRFAASVLGNLGFVLFCPKQLVKILLSCGFFQ